MRVALFFAAVAFVAGMLAYIIHLDGKIDAARAEVSRLNQELDAANRGIEELGRDADATWTRNRASTAGKEAIIRAPEGDNGPIAKTLSDALKTAGEIGGLK